MTERISGNRNIVNNALLLQFISKNGKVEEIKDSAVGSTLLAVYGAFVLSDEYKKIMEDKMVIEIYKDIDIAVKSMDKEREILCRNDSDVNVYRKPFLLYGLTAEFEFLMHMPLHKDNQFCLKCALRRSRPTEEITAEIELSEHYKMYKVFENLMEQLISDRKFLCSFCYENFEPDSARTVCFETSGRFREKSLEDLNNEEYRKELGQR